MTTTTVLRPPDHAALARQHGLEPRTHQGPRHTVWSGRTKGRVSIPRGFRPLGGGWWASDERQALIDLSAGWIVVIGYVKPAPYRDVVRAIETSVRNGGRGMWATMAGVGA